MKTTGRAKGPGPHRTPKSNGREGNPKARSGAASPQGFTVRCFWVAARDWRCRVHRQTKGGFVSSGRRFPGVPTRLPWLHPVRAPRHHAGVHAHPPRSGTPACACPGKSERDRTRNLDFSPLTATALCVSTCTKSGLIRKFQSATACEWARQRQGFARPCAIR